MEEMTISKEDAKRLALEFRPPRPCSLCTVTISANEAKFYDKRRNWVCMGCFLRLNKTKIVQCYAKWGNFIARFNVCNEPEREILNHIFTDSIWLNTDFTSKSGEFFQEYIFEKSNQFTANDKGFNEFKVSMELLLQQFKNILKEKAS